MSAPRPSSIAQVDPRTVGVRGAILPDLRSTGARAEVTQPQHAAVAAVIDIDPVRAHRTVHEDAPGVEQPAVGNFVGSDLAEVGLAEHDVRPEIPGDSADRGARLHHQSRRLRSVRVGSLKRHLGGHRDCAGVRREPCRGCPFRNRVGALCVQDRGVGNRQRHQCAAGWSRGIEGDRHLDARAADDGRRVHRHRAEIDGDCRAGEVEQENGSENPEAPDR